VNLKNTVLRSDAV